jgi:hypothetical protein
MATLAELLHPQRFADGDPRAKPMPLPGQPVPVPESVSTLDQIFNGTGVPERATLMNEVLNPTVALRDAGKASQTLFDPETTGWGRVGALGNMASNMAGVLAPAMAVKSVGGKPVDAIVEALTNYSAKPKMLADEFMADEFGGIKVYHGSPRQFDAFEIGKPSSSGVESPAVWFSDSENVARGYGPNMTAAEIDIEDGLDFDFQGRSTVFFDGKHRTPSELAKRIAEINDDMRKGYGLPEGHESDLIYDMMDAGWPEVGGPESVSGLTLRNVDDSMQMFGGETATNYAVFDENLISIVKKYGVAGAAAMLGMSQADMEAQMQPQDMRSVLGQ